MTKKELYQKKVRKKRCSTPEMEQLKRAVISQVKRINKTCKPRKAETLLDIREEIVKAFNNFTSGIVVNWKNKTQQEKENTEETFTSTRDKVVVAFGAIRQVAKELRKNKTDEETTKYKTLLLVYKVPDVLGTSIQNEVVTARIRTQKTKRKKRKRRWQHLTTAWLSS